MYADNMYKYVDSRINFKNRIFLILFLHKKALVYFKPSFNFITLMKKIKYLNILFYK